MKILVTGGAGYIGSHTVVELLNSKHEVVVVDNLSNSSFEAIRRVEEITGESIPFYEVDIRDQSGLRRVMAGTSFDACIHFAGLKAVEESVQEPLKYYDSNVNGTLCLLKAMEESGCKNIIFSSSATVYGDPAEVPIKESCLKGVCTNPYGQTKSMIEQILTDIQTADPVWNVVLLRYFNPVGAHSSGKIGEDPRGIPNNLMPYITQVAVGRRSHLNIFGDDYDTPDGTGVRDYIHVMDLAKGHVSALKAIKKDCGVATYNLGTGKGYSVLDVVRAFEAVNHLVIPCEVQKRRPGDVAACWSDSTKIWKELGWKARYDMNDMCRDAWNWQKNNPNGFND